MAPLLLQPRGLVPGLAGEIGGEQGIELIPAGQQRLFVILRTGSGLACVVPG
ncbi:hypothetical protein D3C76_1043600 [compost metagenome]